MGQLIPFPINKRVDDEMNAMRAATPMQILAAVLAKNPEIRVTVDEIRAAADARVILHPNDQRRDWSPTVVSPSSATTKPNGGR
jgi:hypothetical protein